MDKILDYIFNSNFMGAKEGIHEILFSKLSERLEDISKEYTNDIFRESTITEEAEKISHKELADKLNKFDVHYRFSDDPSFFRKGKNQEYEIRNHLKKFSAEEKKALKKDTKPSVHPYLGEETKEKKHSKKKAKSVKGYTDLEKINRQKEAEFGRIDREV